MMRKLTFVAMLLLALFALTAFVVTAQEAAKEEGKAEVKAAVPAHSYVGAEKCKMCHKAQFTAWEQTPHAKAWAALKPEEQTKAECTVCHMTGKLEDGTAITGIACEACHGPGSDYKSPKIMSKTKFAADKRGGSEGCGRGWSGYANRRDLRTLPQRRREPELQAFRFRKDEGSGPSSHS